MSIKPDNASAYSNLGNALKNLNRFEEALSSFDKAIEINPNFADAYFKLSNIFLNIPRILLKDEAESYKAKFGNSYWESILNEEVMVGFI